MREIWYFLVVVSYRCVLEVRNPELLNPDVCSNHRQGEEPKALARKLSDETFNALNVDFLCYVALINYKNFNEEAEGSKPQLNIREVLVNIDS